ncbi:hypothetical protein GF325_01150 [Candidatus Bathyarchaeota archaeon]|nr:hypothetical protein [Candidatus Bathyarchaeota archaeon]
MDYRISREKQVPKICPFAVLGLGMIPFTTILIENSGEWLPAFSLFMVYALGSFIPITFLLMRMNTMHVILLDKKLEILERYTKIGPFSRRTLSITFKDLLGCSLEAAIAEKVGTRYFINVRLSSGRDLSLTRASHLIQRDDVLPLYYKLRELTEKTPEALQLAHSRKITLEVQENSYTFTFHHHVNFIKRMYRFWTVLVLILTILLFTFLIIPNNLLAISLFNEDTMQARSLAWGVKFFLSTYMIIVTAVISIVSLPNWLKKHREFNQHFTCLTVTPGTGLLKIHQVNKRKEGDAKICEIKTSEIAMILAKTHDAKGNLFWLNKRTVRAFIYLKIHEVSLLLETGEILRILITGNQALASRVENFLQNIEEFKGIESFPV